MAVAAFIGLGIAILAFFVACAFVAKEDWRLAGINAVICLFGIAMLGAAIGATELAPDCTPTGQNGGGS